MKKQKTAMAAVILSAALVWAGCGSGSSSSGSTDSGKKVVKPTIENISGTWTRTVSETMTDNGTDVGTKTTNRSLVFSSDGTFSQVDKIVKDYTDAATADTTEWTAYKGTVSSSDITVTLLAADRCENGSAEITDLSALTWSSYGQTKTFPSIIIDGKLYSEDIVYARTGSGTGLVGEWTTEISSERSSYLAYKQIYTFTDDAVTGKKQRKTAADGSWADVVDLSGTYELDADDLEFTVSGQSLLFKVILAGDYFVMGTEKGYTKK